jgi:hypothetical protein
MDVGMDGSIGFKPYDLRDLINTMKKFPIGSELGDNDHHLDNLLNVDK